MSIEDALMKLAAAVQSLADTSRNHAVPAEAPDRPTKAAKGNSTSNGLDYVKDIKPIALALAKADRPALLAIYKKLGVSVGTELKPEQYPEAKRLIEEAGAGADVA